MLRLTVIALFLGNLLLLAFNASKASSRPDQAPEPPPSATPAQDVPLIRLLSEMHWAEVPPEGKECYSAGPFETAQSRSAVEQQLADRNADYRLRETEALVELGYWVTR